MRVICPFIPGKIRPETRAALDRYAPGWEPIDVSPEHKLDAHHYSRLLVALWRSGDDFCLVEHDIVIHDRVIPQMEACDREWCVFAYGMGAGARMWDGLGCTRFRGALTRRHPQIADFLELISWKALDRESFLALADAGYPAPHTHWPMVGHIHRHGDDPADWTAEHTPPRQPATIVRSVF